MSSGSFATLHGDLLVRKGEAGPSAVKPAILHGSDRDEFSAQRRDVWRAEAPPLRHGFGAPRDMQSQHQARHHALEEPDAETAQAERKVRATLRISREQLRRLRLASALTDQSQQDLLSRALDERLAALGRGPLRHCKCFRPGGGDADGACGHGGEGC